jgi:hypothetical protein
MAKADLSGVAFREVPLHRPRHPRRATVFRFDTLDEES